MRAYYSNLENRAKLSHIPSEETRKKRSISLLKYYSNPQNRQNLSEAQKGHIVTEETRQKIGRANSITLKKPEVQQNMPSLFQKGHPKYFDHHSEEAKQKVREAQTGEGNSMWNGGSSFLPYPAIFNDELKEQIKQRDNYTCQLCGVPECECLRKLHIHHIDYNKENCPENNLISLCNSCNGKVNRNRQHWTEYFTKKLQESTTTIL